MYELFITESDGSTRSLPLETALLVMGRDPSCSLPFPMDAELSRRHLTVEREGEDWFVKDLGSTNGTRLNGQPLQGKKPLNVGDTISASKISLLFRTQAMKNQAPRTVVFDASKFEALSSGTVSVNLRDVLESQDKTPADPTSGKQWVSPLQALIRVGREISQRRPLDELFPVILDLALEAVSGERGVVMVIEEGELELKASRGGEFRISTAVRDRVIVDGVSLMIESIAETPDLKERKSIILQGVRSLLAVPLQTDEKVIGLLYVDALSFVKNFTNDDLSLLTVMANVAAIRIEHERLVEVEQAQRITAAELGQAADIQRRHLPQTPPQWPGLEIAAMHQPSRTVGGDYYDYLRFADGRYAILCGDVAGKGMPAALMMMSVQARAYALAETATNVAEFMTRLNRNMNPTCPPNRFITLLTCVYDANTGVLTYSNGGHNPGLVVRTDGTIEQLTVGGMFVGLLPRLTWEEASVILNPGDMVVLYTDGITEEENGQGEDFGMERLERISLACRGGALSDLTKQIFAAVQEFSQGAAARDDQTLVLFRRSA